MIFNVGAGGGASTADKVKYDNTESGLQSDNVQGAVDELNSSLNNKFAVVTGTLASTVNTDTTLPFPEGFSVDNSVVVDVVVFNSATSLYYPQVSASGTSALCNYEWRLGSNGLVVNARQSNFTGQSIKAIFMKI